MARPDQDYERFVQNVYQTLLSAEGKDTIPVKHNIKIKGVSGQEHQIDVYWEYRTGNIIYKTAVECKFYKSNIGVGKVRDFYGVLSDIPNLRGVMATTIGYQSGALPHAESKGIELLIVRPPRDSDYDWLQMKLKFQGLVATILWKEISLVADLDWCLERGIRPEELRISGRGDPTKIYLQDKRKGEILTFEAIRERLCSDAQNLTVGERCDQVFPEEQVFEDTWLVFPEDAFSEPIKIRQVVVPYVVKEGIWNVDLSRETRQDKIFIKDILRDEYTFYNLRGLQTGGKGRYDLFGTKEEGKKPFSLAPPDDDVD